jgi:hypothetical protein
MKRNATPQRKTIIVLLFAVLAATIYLISLKYAYNTYQETRLVDPLAQVHSLPVPYYIAIVMVAIAALVCLMSRIQSKGVHLFILILLAVMLWYTPYYLAGFLKTPDDLWHVGVAMHIPEVLAGQPITFSYYALEYPASFIFHYQFMSILGIGPMTYIQLFVLFSLCLFVLLFYICIYRLVGPRVALLSLILAIPGLHYFELHPSPHVLGLLLMMTVLVLLLKPRLNRSIIALAMVTVFIIIATHPISPLLLCVFLGAGGVTSWLHQKKFGETQAALFILLAFCFAGWFLWQMLIASTPIMEAAPLSASEPALPSVGETAPILLTGHSTGAWEGIVFIGLSNIKDLLVGHTFIYSGISNLRRGVYFLYGLLAVAAILHVMVRSYRARANLKQWITNFGGLSKNEVFMASSALLLIILTVLLVARDPGLTERSLSFLILTLCCLVALIATRYFFDGVRAKAIAWTPVAVIILFLVISFPMLGYSQDAYTSVPVPEVNGLKFLAASEALDQKTIYIGWPQQLAFYSPYSNSTYQWSGKPDLRVLRTTDYYSAAMHEDLSFDDNRFTRLLYQTQQDAEYSEIYSNPAFHVYLKMRPAAN